MVSPYGVIHCGSLAARFSARCKRICQGVWLGRNPCVPVYSPRSLFYHRQEPHCSFARFCMKTTLAGWLSIRTQSLLVGFSSANSTSGLWTAPSASIAPDELVGGLWPPRAGFVGQNSLARLILPLVQDTLHKHPCRLNLVTPCKER